MDPVRVDDGCHAKLTDRSRGNTFAPPPPRFDAPQPSKTLYQGSMEPRNPRVEDSFDADLKRALEMSLEDAKGNSSSGFVPQAQLKSQSKPNGTTKKPAPEPELELDADLEAAIAASLADMEEQKKKYATDFRQQATSSSSGTPFVAPKNDFELSPVEAENINLFSTLVDRMQHQPPGAILREPQIQELYESIGKLRPKLARTYGETMSKHETLLDLHAKLSTVVRYYDRMLEERLSSTYNQAGAMYGMPRPASNVYPQIPTGAPAYTGSENYYSSNPAPSDPYGRPQPTYQSQPQQPYPQFDQRAPPPQSDAGSLPAAAPATLATIPQPCLLRRRRTAPATTTPALLPATPLATAPTPIFDTVHPTALRIPIASTTLHRLRRRGRKLLLQRQRTDPPPAHAELHIAAAADRLAAAIQPRPAAPAAAATGTHFAASTARVGVAESPVSAGECATTATTAAAGSSSAAAAAAAAATGAATTPASAAATAAVATAPPTTTTAAATAAPTATTTAE
jgi:hypothetical protein